MSEIPYTITPARYAKGKMIIRTKGRDGYKSRAYCIAGDGLGLHYVGRSRGYTASPSQAERFERLYTAGFDASWWNGEFAHDGRGLRGLSWREADRLAKEWQAGTRQPCAGHESETSPLPEGLKSPEALSGAEIDVLAAWPIAA